MATKAIINKKQYSPEGLLKYCTLNTPNTQFNADGTYDCVLCLPEGEEATTKFVEKLQKLHDEAKEKHAMRDIADMAPAKAKQAEAKLGFNNFFTQELDEETGDETGNLLFRFKMYATRKDFKTGAIVPRTPIVVDCKGKQIDLSSVQIGHGSYGKICFSSSSYYVQGNYGISLWLDGVQIKKLNEVGGSMFGEIDGEEIDQAEVDVAFPPAEDSDDF